MHTHSLQRRLAAVFIALTLGVPLAPVWVGPSVPAVMAATPMGATLSVLSTPVDVASTDSGVFVVATNGQTLYQGDTVRTGSGGMALLTFFDGSESQLGGAAQLQIEQADASPAPQIGLLQTAGVTINHVIPMPTDGSFRTDTPAATGLVRGTSYIVVVGDGGTCQPKTAQACLPSASIILLTDRNGHVGRVDVTANASDLPAIQLTEAGNAAAASNLLVVAAQLEPTALSELEAVANARDDPAASLTTELTARSIATTLAPLVAAVTAPTVVSEPSPVASPTPAPLVPAALVTPVAAAPTSAVAAALAPSPAIAGPVKTAESAHADAVAPPKVTEPAHVTAGAPAAKEVEVKSKSNSSTTTSSSQAPSPAAASSSAHAASPAAASSSAPASSPAAPSGSAHASTTGLTNSGHASDSGQASNPGNSAHSDKPDKPNKPDKPDKPDKH